MEKKVERKRRLSSDNEVRKKVCYEEMNKDRNRTKDGKKRRERKLNNNLKRTRVMRTMGKEREIQAQRKTAKEKRA